MRAAICRSYGPPGVVTVDEWPAPELPGSPPGGAVRVRVRAAAVNFPDVLIVADRYQLSVPTPFIPGSEFAGEVMETDPAGAAGLSPGDRVFGAVMVGAFAQEVVVPAASLTRTPDGVDDASAAAFGVAHRTAYHVLRSVARVVEGEKLVVLGAGGGVGLATVQLARALGANVTAVASTGEKLDAAKAAGATRLVNHRAGDLRVALREALPGGADVVVDPVGASLAEPALRSLRWGGRYVTVGYAGGDIPRIPLNLVLLKGCAVLGFEFRSFVQHLPEEAARNEAELIGLLAEGLVRPHIGARYRLDDAVSALLCVAEGRAVGKVVIEIP